MKILYHPLFLYNVLNEANKGKNLFVPGKPYMNITKRISPLTHVHILPSNYYLITISTSTIGYASQLNGKNIASDNNTIVFKFITSFPHSFLNTHNTIYISKTLVNVPASKLLLLLLFLCLEADGFIL